MHTFLCHHAYINLLTIIPPYHLRPRPWSDLLRYTWNISLPLTCLIGILPGALRCPWQSWFLGTFNPEWPSLPVTGWRRRVSSPIEVWCFGVFFASSQCDVICASKSLNERWVNFSGNNISSVTGLPPINYFPHAFFHLLMSFPRNECLIRDCKTPVMTFLPELITLIKWLPDTLRLKKARCWAFSTETQPLESGVR